MHFLNKLANIEHYIKLQTLRLQTLYINIKYYNTKKHTLANPFATLLMGSYSIIIFSTIINIRLHLHIYTFALSPGAYSQILMPIWFAQQVGKGINSSVKTLTSPASDEKTYCT